MGVIVDWDTPEKHAVLFNFTNPWTWTEFYVARPQGDVLAESVDHPVAAIILLPHPLQLPPGAMTQGRKIAMTRHNKFVVSIVVTDNVLVKTMFPLFARINQEIADSYRLVRSLEEARAVADQVLSARAANEA